MGKTRGRRLVRAHYPDTTIKSYRNILLNKKGAFPVFTFLDKIVTAPSPKFTIKKSQILENGLNRSGLKESTINNRKKVCRIFLKYLAYNGVIIEESDAIDSIVQYQVCHDPKAILTPQQRDVIDNGAWSPMPFVDLRNQVAYKLLRRHGDRPEIEINRINMEDVDTRLWIIRISGKGGSIRYHRLFHDEIPLIEKYIYERNKRIASIPGYLEDNAFIIRLHPKMAGVAKKVKPTWRLDLPGIYAIYARMRNRNPILAGTNPYLSRHTRITHAHIICSILGIPLEFASKAFGNSLAMRILVYDRSYEMLEEFLCCDFDTQLLSLFEELRQYCEMKLKENSNDQIYHYIQRRIEDRIGEVGLYKMMIGRSPSLRHFYQSDSQDDFYALWEKDRSKGFLNQPKVLEVTSFIVFGFENSPL
jgi:site-specific recombinase XerD